MNITEDYVSYEVAKLLKEKGFDEKVSTHYLIHPSGFPEFFDKKDEFTEPEDVWLKCPTLQMAMKWLRIKHNILLFLLPAQENGKLVYLVEVWTWNEEEGIYESAYAPMPRKEPEQAVEAALKYCLENLI